MAEKKAEGSIRDNKRREKALQRPVVVVVTSLLLCVFCAVSMGMEIASPNRYLQQGQQMSQAIVAEEAILDEAETQRARDEAADAVPSVYVENEEAFRSAQIRNERFFAAMDTLRTDADALRRQNVQASERDSDLRDLTEGTLTVAEWDLVLGDAGHEQLNMTYGEWMDRSEINRMLALQQTTYNTWLRVLTLQSNAQMRKGTAEGEEDDIRASFVETLRRQTPLSVQTVLPKIAEYLIQPTMFLDENLTEQSREVARDRVIPILIQPGEVIAEAGERLSDNAFRILKDTGYALNISQLIGRWLGVVFLHLAIALMVGRMISRDRHKPLRSWREAIMLLSLGLLTLILGNLFMAGEYRVNPVLLGVILVTQLLSPNMGMRFLLMLLPSISAIGIGGMSIDYWLFAENLLGTLFGGMMVAVLTDKTSKRFRVLQASVAGGFMMIIVVSLFAMLKDADTIVFLKSVSYTFAVALLSGVLAIGLLPLWELIFAVASPSSLVELGDINHPLLKRMMIEAPGTYNHSLMVASLGEAVADAIGANANLVKVGAYFHDIGKLKRPMFFSENQQGFNPHDEMDPAISSAIITAHVTDGLEMAKKHKIPARVCDLIAQHHGDSTTAAFYYKAAEQQGVENVFEGDYRYAGVKPQSKESAILMICDSIEAAVRSMDSPTKEQVYVMIDKVIAGKVNDGQLQDSDMRLSELETLRQTVRSAYAGMLHERVKYPDMETLRSELNMPALSQGKDSGEASHVE